MKQIPFNCPSVAGKEIDYIQEALKSGHLCGDGPFTRRCQRWLEDKIGCRRALLTPSCTSALELAAMLVGISSGDEVIMPSFTFTSTASAFVLRGAVPVFVDIRPDTLNIDEAKIEEAITGRTKAIVPVHYAGVGCAMGPIGEIARRHRLFVIEDAAQGIDSTYLGLPLGGVGQLGAMSFHDSKNIISGEGGALLINEERYVERAEILREKGTNRTQFVRGQVDKYTWVDIGSSYLMNEVTAAFLWGQMERIADITRRRREIWQKYHTSLLDLEIAGMLTRPNIPSECSHNGHIYYILLPTPDRQKAFISFLRREGISAHFHYPPLHSSEMGRRFGRVGGGMSITESVSERLVRLPVWIGVESHLEFIISTVRRAIEAVV